MVEFTSTDGLSVASGPNRGEAAFLGESSFDPVRYTENLAHVMRQEALLKKKQEEENAALLTDEIKSEWASDDLNYFQPKLQALRDETIKLFRETDGNLNPIQKAEIQNKYAKIKNEALINSTLRKDYVKKVQELDDDKSGTYNRDASIKLLQIWNNPYSVPELKQQIQEQYGGNVNAWRAENEHKFQLVPSYNEDKYYSDVTKDEKPQPYQVRDEKGNLVYETLPTGEKAYKEGKRLTDQQVEAITTRILNGKEYRDIKTKEVATQAVDNMFSIGQDGVVSFPANITQAEKERAQRVIQLAGDMGGLSPEEIKRRLVKGYIATNVEAKNAEGAVLKQIGFAPKPTNVNVGDNKKEKATIATHYYQTAEEVAQNPNMSPDQIAEMFGGKAIVQPSTGLFMINIPLSPTTKPFVIVPLASTLGRNKSKGETKFSPNSSMKGQVAGTPKENYITWKKDGNTVTPNTPGAKAYGQIIYDPVKVNTKSETEIDAAFALFQKEPGNENVTKQAYKAMLENANNIGEDFKVEYDLSDPVQRTYYDQALGGMTISQTGFNREISATKKTAKPASKSTSSANPTTAKRKRFNPATGKIEEY